MADSVRVDTEVVRSAARQADAAGATTTPGSAQVQPSASDMVSVGASIRFTAQVTLARNYTVMANATARQFGVKLDASAGAYDDQEAQSAETLGTGGAGAVVPAARTPPAGQVVPADPWMHPTFSNQPWREANCNALALLLWMSTECILKKMAP